MRMIGLGPVAVFAASNFPLAFSVAGGDTASALAAGCPVVLKAHSAHPGTSELVGRAVVKAVELCGLPAGVFSLLTGSGNGIGQELVRHPSIKAVGFTGSRSGGLALMAVAAARPVPIPVYAEMSSINPVFLMPQALAARAEEIATGFAGSLVLGVGQMCTNPGLVIGIGGADLDRFAGTAAQALAGGAACAMLSPGIAGSFQRGITQLAEHADVKTLALAPQSEGKGAPALFVTSGAAFPGAARVVGRGIRPGVVGGRVQGYRGTASSRRKPGRPADRHAATGRWRPGSGACVAASVGAQGRPHPGQRFSDRR